jgi:hypothetical protein
VEKAAKFPGRTEGPEDPGKGGKKVTRHERGLPPQGVVVVGQLWLLVP